jgi:hypothetical protein
MFSLEIIIFAVVCLILGGAITVFGFSLGLGSFLPNFISGWGQFFFELIIGLFIVDKFINRQNSKRWMKIRHIHYRILNEHLIKLLIEICNRLGYTEIAKNLMYKKKVNKDISPIVENLVKELNYLDSQDSPTCKANFLQYYEGVKEEIKEVRVVFIPRIIEHSDNQNLANLLSELDLLLIKFEDDIIRCKSKENAHPNIINFIRLIECISDIVSKLVE